MRASSHIDPGLGCADDLHLGIRDVCCSLSRVLELLGALETGVGLRLNYNTCQPILTGGASVSDITSRKGACLARGSRSVSETRSCATEPWDRVGERDWHVLFHAHLCAC
eukprot:6081375-Pyramimonas_sp.AAC.1